MILVSLIQQALSTRVWEIQPCEFWTFKICKNCKLMTEIVSTEILVQEHFASLQVVRLADFLALVSLNGESEAEEKCDIWAF